MKGSLVHGGGLTHLGVAQGTGSGDNASVLYFLLILSQAVNASGLGLAICELVVQASFGSVLLLVLISIYTISINTISICTISIYTLVLSFYIYNI